MAMRTTIDLPDDLHFLARQLAHDTGRTLSEVVAGLMRAGLPARQPAAPVRVGARGWPIVSVGCSVTAEDVRALDDEE